MTPNPPPSQSIWEKATPDQQKQLCQLLTQLISQYLTATKLARPKGGNNESTEQN